jgi:hypothetical protein
MSQRSLSPIDLVNVFQNLTMSITSHINLTKEAKAIEMAQAFIKVKAPNVYYKEWFKL